MSSYLGVVVPGIGNWYASTVDELQNPEVRDVPGHCKMVRDTKMLEQAL